MLYTENVKVTFEEDALDDIADYAVRVNNETENIGARRLHTIIERLMEEISFNAPDTPGAVTINSAYVKEKLESIVKSQDLSQFIL